MQEAQDISVLEKIEKKQKLSQDQIKTSQENQPNYKEMTKEQILELHKDQLNEQAKKRICLTNFNKYDIERDIYKFIKKFQNQKPKDLKQFQVNQGEEKSKLDEEDSEDEIKVQKIFKEKNKFFSIIEFTDEFEKEKFLERFRDQKNKGIVKKVKLQQRTPEELKKVSKGKSISQIKQKIELKQKIPVPTQEQIEEQKNITLVSRVCPYLNIDYQEQLSLKKQQFVEVLEKWGAKAKEEMQGKDHLDLPDWLNKQYPVEITSVLDCEEQYRIRWRNKMEFTIGKDWDGNIKVGMNKGQISNGTISVENAKECIVLTEEGLLIAEILEEYIIKQGQFKVYDRYHKTGFYKSLQVRQSSKTKQIMISIIVQNNIEENQLEQEKQNFLKLFINEQSEKLKLQLQKEGYKIVSLNIQSTNNMTEGNGSEPMESLYGQQYYIEEILGKKFKVSPNAFLQNHIQQTDKLYSLIQSLIQQDINQDTVFLDVCSGLGTIGMCMAEKCKRAIGIEMIQDACEAAKENADLNSITNYDVVCAKVEDVMLEIIQKHKQENPNTKIVAVVDPPRPGLHKNVVKTLRNCELIDNLVYVACSPSSIIDNLNYLCLPKTSGRGGYPFTPTQSYVVDLFPNTSHYEGVFFLQRQHTLTNLSQSESEQEQENRD
ncbi:hypothetical protein PPERSA_05699 [Pseudocohnilembus persalinus]|uniref:S-adenosyl-L-methionine-dependent methyltransferase n=1 Tax=Pseudocohnilembus persalinus TaxID=266149 RepID=A0A0V0QM96_PSEPJ|nr:hypothetical protein PPERSA_05699 [Pseudocohnilembus persalinus]|eukprot:KRX03341.1 hypothetical protein PPERSA_05699 [Pseudocohnilembus persalinus]